MKNKFFLYLKSIVQYIAAFSGAKNSIFITQEDMIDFIVKNNLSLIRFGDGEFCILERKDIHYQCYSKELAICLDNIIKEYIDSCGASRYCVGMPSFWLKVNALFLLKKRVYFSCWTHTRYFFKKRYDKNVVYTDAFLFKRNNEAVYEKLWVNKGIQKIIFVHNDKKYALDFERKYGITTVFVQIPYINAFESKDEILKNILAYSDRNQNQLILVSAGPCGKVLVYELCNMGFRAIDTGHCWDNPLEG